jgi:DnaJ-class molecular chaperone
VRQKLQKLEGTDINFYEYVGVKKGISATTEEIASAYRRKSLAWQYVRFFCFKLTYSPDKRRKGTSRKEAQDRFTLLGYLAFLKSRSFI